MPQADSYQKQIDLHAFEKAKEVEAKLMAHTDGCGQKYAELGGWFREIRDEIREIKSETANEFNRIYDALSSYKEKQQAWKERIMIGVILGLLSVVGALLMKGWVWPGPTP